MDHVARLFLTHPASVNETYFQHFRFAMTFAFWLLMAGLAALVHAILPFLFEKTAGRIILRLAHKIESRH